MFTSCGSSIIVPRVYSSHQVVTVNTATLAKMRTTLWAYRR